VCVVVVGFCASRLLLLRDVLNSLVSRSCGVFSVLLSRIDDQH